jgi:autotransporter-associated beta strand protein
MARAAGSACLLLLAAVAAADPGHAQDATWSQTPNSGSLTEPTNWDGGALPGSAPGDTAFFGASTITSLTLGMTVMGFGNLTLTSGAGAYTLANAGGLGFAGGGITINGGSLTITNNGDIAFYGTSSAGTATFINNSGHWLAFTQSSSAADAAITNNGRLTFSNQASGGTAHVTNNGGGWIDFSASVGPAPDNINKIGSINGAGDVYLGAHQLMIGGSNRDSDISGVISECGSGSCMAPPPGGAYGSLAKTGTGTLTLSGANTYGGGTSLLGGTISVSSDSNLGIGGDLNFDGGILRITGTSFSGTTRTINWGVNGGGFDIADAAATFTLTDSPQVFSGPGGLIKRGAGTLVIDNNQNYEGLTDVQAGTLKAGSSGTLAFMSRHNIAAGATLDLGGTAAQIIGSLTGAGTVTNSGPDPTLLMIGFDDTAATFAGTIKDGAPGTIQVQIMNRGTVTTFTGTNTYTGGTSICACSTLQLGDGGTTGSITGNVENGGMLIFNRSNAYTFAGVISDYAGDAGTLVQAGPGNTILTGLNTYTGPTVVNAGTLSVNGSIASSSLTTVNPGGTLGGTGTVGETRIAGGTLAPGNSIGTLNVQGNLVFTAASHYMIEVDPAGSDRTNVTGSATLNGATVNASFAPGSYITRQYTILNAALGVNGTFGSQVNTNLPTNFTSKLSYDANNAYLDLTLSYVPPTPPGPTPGPNYTPLNTNQGNVASTLVSYFNRTGGIPLVFGALSPSGLTQVSGETGTGLQQTSIQAMNLFLGLITDPTIAGRAGFAAVPGPSAFADEALAYAPRNGTRNGAERDAYGLMTKAAPRGPVFDARWNVWTAGFGGSQTTDGNIAQGSSSTTSRTFGFAVGADYLWAPQTVAGFALSGGGNTFSVAGAGTGSSDMFQAGAYLRHTTGSTYVSAAAAYGWQDVTTDRTVTTVGFDHLRGRFHANTFSGRVEFGNRFVDPWTGGIGLTPYAALQITALDLPAYAESLVAGAGNFALGYAAKTVTAPRAELGLRSDKSFALDGALLTLRGRAAWAHDTNPERSAQATFQSLPGASFVVNGAVAARNSALTSASAELAWTNGLSLAATFEGEFSETTRSYAGKGVARYTW